MATKKSPLQTKPMPKARGVQPNISPNTILKKFVHKANVWCVSYWEWRNNKNVQYQAWFIHEEDADNFIKQKNEETKNN